MLYYEYEWNNNSSSSSSTSSCSCSCSCCGFVVVVVACVVVTAVQQQQQVGRHRWAAVHHTMTTLVIPRPPVAAVIVIRDWGRSACWCEASQRALVTSVSRTGFSTSTRSMAKSLSTSSPAPTTDMPLSPLKSMLSVKFKLCKFIDNSTFNLICTQCLDKKMRHV